MRKTLTALLFAATLPAVALAMPDEGPHHGGMRGEPHGMMFKELDLSREQRESIGKLMREQMKSRHDITQRYLDNIRSNRCSRFCWIKGQVRLHTRCHGQNHGLAYRA